MHDFIDFWPFALGFEWGYHGILGLNHSKEQIGMHLSNKLVFLEGGSGWDIWVSFFVFHPWWLVGLHRFSHLAITSGITVASEFTSFVAGARRWTVLRLMIYTSQKLVVGLRLFGIIKLYVMIPNLPYSDLHMVIPTGFYMFGDCLCTRFLMFNQKPDIILFLNELFELYFLCLIYLFTNGHICFCVATRQESTVSTTWTVTHEEERSVPYGKLQGAYWTPFSQSTVWV